VGLLLGLPLGPAAAAPGPPSAGAAGGVQLMRALDEPLLLVLSIMAWIRLGHLPLVQLHCVDLRAAAGEWH
jgi:hypothetical protein